jgi:methylmalonyl-CoA mutase N-terminal domain/subunit
VAGSYAIEVLTNQIEQGAEALLHRIDRAGGTLAAIETGLIQREIQESAYQAQLAIDAGDAVVVGVNRFSDQRLETGVGLEGPIQPPSAGPQLLLFGTDPETERLQIERVRAVRASRSASAWRAALEAVTQEAREGGNLVPPIIAAVESLATVGEIADAMRAVFGEYSETATI